MNEAAGIRSSQSMKIDYETCLGISERVRKVLNSRILWRLVRKTHGYTSINFFCSALSSIEIPHCFFIQS